MAGNEGEIFFVLLQNVVVGCLPTTVFYRRITIYIYLMVFSSLCEKLCTLHCICTVLQSKRANFQFWKHLAAELDTNI